jgi:hypothetical protein
MLVYGFRNYENGKAMSDRRNRNYDCDHRSYDRDNRNYDRPKRTLFAVFQCRFFTKQRLLWAIVITKTTKQTPKITIERPIFLFACRFVTFVITIALFGVYEGNDGRKASKKRPLYGERGAVSNFKVASPLFPFSSPFLSFNIHATFRSYARRRQRCTTGVFTHSHPIIVGNS